MSTSDDTEKSHDPGSDRQELDRQGHDDATQLAPARAAPGDLGLRSGSGQRQTGMFSELLEGARHALAAGDTSGAVESLRQAVVLEPVQIDAQEMLGAALCASGDLAGGIAVFESTVDHHPTSARAHFNLAAAYRQAGQIPEAHHQLDVALRLDPLYRTALAARAEWSGDIVAPDAQAETVEQPPEPDAGAASAAAPEFEHGDQASAPASIDPQTAVTSGETAGTLPTGTETTDGAPQSTEGDGELPQFVPAVDAESAAEVSTASESATEATSAEGSPLETPLMTSPPSGTARVQPSSPGKPPVPSFEAHPPPTGAPLEVFDEEDVPSVGQMIGGVLLHPRAAIQDDLPVFTGSAPNRNVTLILWLIAALLWGFGLVFHPGTALKANPSNLLLTFILSFLCPALLIGTQTALVVAASASFTGGSFSADFRTLIIRFAFVWAVANLAAMGIADLLQLTTDIAASLFIQAPALLWCLALNFRVVTQFYPYDFGRAFATIFFSQVVAYAIALGILYPTLLS